MELLMTIQINKRALPLLYFSLLFHSVMQAQLAVVTPVTNMNVEVSSISKRLSVFGSPGIWTRRALRNRAA